nr:MAG TPA: hypothetical protein [Bacteriophage sp.]
MVRHKFLCIYQLALREVWISQLIFQCFIVDFHSITSFR